MATSPELFAALLSDIGMKRKQNQDSGLSRPDLGLFMVADGMGGHQGGETASRICVEKVCESVEASVSKSTDDRTLLQQGLLLANQAVYEQSTQDPQLKGMGTTATILKISKYLATIAQVGDSRVYYWNRDGIWQLTRDHSLVQEKLRAGLITRAQLKTDEMKNVITRSVGYEPNMNIDLYQMPVASGDGFLICSDGLSGPVEDRVMFEILEETIHSKLSLSDAASRLVNAANQRGGDDNVTVVLVQLGQ